MRESLARDLCGMGGGGFRPSPSPGLMLSSPSMPLMLGLTGNLPDTDLLGGRGVSRLVSLQHLLVQFRLCNTRTYYLRSGVSLPNISRCLYSRRKSLTCEQT